MTTPTKIGLDTDPGWMTPYGKGEKEFDENQPRDEQGRWTDEGGGGGENPTVYGVDSGYSFHDQNDEWAAGLPQSDRRALISYAGFESDEINAIQRGDEATVRADLAQYHMPSSYEVGHGAPNVVDEKGVQERIDQIKAEAATISRVIDDGPVMKEDTEVYRGLSLSRDDFEQMVKEGKLDDPGFQSTMVGLEDRARGYAVLDQGHHELAVRDPAWARSLGKEYPARESVFARIVVPKGTHYADIEAARRLSSSPGYKGESEILLKGASYTVESVTRDAGRLSYDAQRGITVPYHEVTLIYHPLKTKEFDPNQARDEAGRWTSEGGGGVSTESQARADSYPKAPAGWKKEVIHTSWRDNLPERVKGPGELEKIFSPAEIESLKRSLGGEKDSLRYTNGNLTVEFTDALTGSMWHGAEGEGWTQPRDGVEAAMRELDDLQRTNPASKAVEIRFVNFAPGMEGLTTHLPDRVLMQIDDHYLQYPTLSVEITQTLRDQAPKSTLKATGLKYVTTHEWGHAMESGVGEKRVYELGERARGVSQYGRLSRMPSEAFADAFAAYVIAGDKAEPEALALAKELKWKR